MCKNSEEILQCQQHAEKFGLHISPVPVHVQRPMCMYRVCLYIGLHTYTYVYAGLKYAEVAQGLHHSQFNNVIPIYGCILLLFTRSSKFCCHITVSFRDISSVQNVRINVMLVFVFDTFGPRNNKG